MLIKDDKIASEEEDLVETFNKHYINIAQNPNAINPYNVALGSNASEDNAAIDLVREFHENSLGIAKMKQETEETSI